MKPSIWIGRRLFVAALSGLAVASLGTTAQAGPAYKVIDLADLGNLGGGTQFVAGNPQGDTLVGQRDTNDRAFLFKVGSGFVDLSGGAWRSAARGAFGDQQVGSKTLTSFSPPHAVLWTGTAASAVQLLPDPDVQSSASAIYQNRIAGGVFVTTPHAVLWSGADHHMTDLHPGTGWYRTDTTSVSADQVAGFGIRSNSNQTHAVVWTADSPDALVDLHPTVYRQSSALAVDSGEQVGFVFGSLTDNHDHAALWHSTRSSFIDLTPAGYVVSDAYSVNNGIQVGSGQQVGGVTHALAWFGSPESAVDLNQFFGSNLLDARAFYVDAGGHIFGTANIDEFPGQPGDNTSVHLVEWVPTRAVPLPPAVWAGLATMTCAAAVNWVRKPRH